MKKIAFIIFIFISFVMLAGSSIWEGSAAAVSGSELPEDGAFIATNSFPPNTVVDVTNLENGRTVRALAISGHEIPGLLALISRDAASAIGLPGRTLGRIRMSQTADPVAFSRFSEGLASSGDPDFDPVAFVVQNRYNPALSDAHAVTAGTERFEGGERIVDVIDEDDPYYYYDMDYDPDYDLSLEYDDFWDIYDEFDEITEEPELLEVEPIAVFTAEEAPGSEPSFVNELSLVPAEARPPEWNRVPDVSHFIAPVSPPVAEAVERTPPAVLYPHVFSVPMISSLETGKYYLQIAAYSRIEAVETEISNIDSSLPVAVMHAGSPESPIYRVLIGPVNLGESGALLHRFRSTHSDAFVRVGT